MHIHRSLPNTTPWLTLTLTFVTSAHHTTGGETESEKEKEKGRRRGNGTGERIRHLISTLPTEKTAQLPVRLLAPLASQPLIILWMVVKPSGE